jgi:hypothetical protein
VDQQFKEIEKLKLEARNARKSAYQPGQGGNAMSAMGAGLVSKLNLNRQSGYTPGLNTGSMFNTNRSTVPLGGAGGDQTQQPDSSTQENRYSSGRYLPMGANKEVAQSMEFSKMGPRPEGGTRESGFLSPKSMSKKMPEALGTGLGSQPGNNTRKIGQGAGMGLGGNELKLAAPEEPQLDTKKNLVSTPSSKNDDDEQ